MKTLTLLIGSLALLGPIMVLNAAEQISADELGLSKTSVFKEATPKPFGYSEGAPGSPQNPELERGFPGAPPQIPHAIEAYMPLTAKNNQCLSCHNNPSMRGKPQNKGVPTPMPESHYTNPAFGKPEAGLPGKVDKAVAGSRYVCTQCHAPQANVKPLVKNTF